MNLLKRSIKEPSLIPFFILAAVFIGSWAYSAIEPHYWEAAKGHYPIFIVALAFFVLVYILDKKVGRVQGRHSQ